MRGLTSVIDEMIMTWDFIDITHDGGIPGTRTLRSTIVEDTFKFAKNKVSALVFHGINQSCTGLT